MADAHTLARQAAQREASRIATARTTAINAADAARLANRRDREGPTLHDGAIHDPRGCPRGLTECAPLARYASPGYASFMCCGETAAAPVPTDRLRLCIKSTHATGVDLIVNLDERDAVHTSAVLMAGLGALGSDCITASDGSTAPDTEVAHG